MDRWIRHLAKQIGAAALCLTVLFGMVRGLSPLELLLRGLMVGLILYFAIVLIGGLIGQALLRMVVEQQAHDEEARRAEKRQRREDRARREGADAADDDDDDEDEDEDEDDSAPSQASA